MPRSLTPIHPNPRGKVRGAFKSRQACEPSSRLYYFWYQTLTFKTTLQFSLFMRIAQGAEATITKKGNTVIKERTRKNYRHPELDEKLRIQRTRKEATILSKLPVNGPSLIDTDRKAFITMDFIKGHPIKEILSDNLSIATEIGVQMAKLHDANIIHGDLTTSNMILNDNVNLIDFGLSYTSPNIEDKAVDLHLFHQALASKHHTIAKEAFDLFKQGYSNSTQSKEVLKRLQAVEKRGRNKAKF